MSRKCFTYHPSGVSDLQRVVSFQFCWCNWCHCKFSIFTDLPVFIQMICAYFVLHIVMPWPDDGISLIKPSMHQTAVNGLTIHGILAVLLLSLNGIQIPSISYLVSCFSKRRPGPFTTESISFHTFNVCFNACLPPYHNFRFHLLLLLFMYVYKFM